MRSISQHIGVIFVFCVIYILIISTSWVYIEEQNEEHALASKYKIDYAEVNSNINLWEKAQDALTKSIKSQITKVGCTMTDADINTSGMITQTVTLKHFIALLSANDTVYTQYHGFTFRVVTMDEYCWEWSSNQLAFAVFRGFQGFGRWDDLSYESVTNFSVVHGRTIYRLRLDDYYVFWQDSPGDEIFTNYGL
jgi:hypothetical protein